MSASRTLFSASAGKRCVAEEVGVGGVSLGEINEDVVAGLRIAEWRLVERAQPLFGDVGFEEAALRDDDVRVRREVVVVAVLRREPVLEAKARNTREMAQIAGRKRCVSAQRRGGNENVGVRDGQAGAL